MAAALLLHKKPASKSAGFLCSAVLHAARYPAGGSGGMGSPIATLEGAPMDRMVLVFGSMPSDGAGFITGQVLSPNGGFVI